jgi:hypothetical protein
MTSPVVFLQVVRLLISLKKLSKGMHIREQAD